MRKLFPLIFLAICSCIQPTDKKNTSLEDSLKTKENELLKREISLKEKELEESKKELEAANKKDIPISELYKQVKQGVFIIYTQGSDNISQGTGFFLNNSGIAISNYHVFENADKAVVILDNGEKCLINKIIEYDKEKDFVIFKVDNQLNSCYALQISTTLPEIGAICFAIGNPKGLSQTLSIGNISGYRDENNLIQTTTEITHGSSGGPLFNTLGQVVGIISSGFGEANLNFAININSIPFENIISNTIAPSTNTNSRTDEIQILIKNYFDAMLEQNYYRIAECYTPTLDRYYSKFNIASKDAIDEDRNYKRNNGIIPKEIQIDWENAVLTKAEEGYYVSLNLNYRIQRSNLNKPTQFKLAIFITVTNQMKISSIYENIIRYK